MSAKPKGDPETVTGRGILVFFAQGPDKEVLRSSVSNFKAVARRWAKKRGPEYRVVKHMLPLNVAELPEMTVKPYKGTAEKKTATKKTAAAKKTAKPKAASKSRGKPSKAKPIKAKATAPKERRKRVSANADDNRVAV
jgi:hypothetical protein